MAQINISIPDDLKKEVRIAAIENDTNASEFIKQAIKEKMERMAEERFMEDEQNGVRGKSIFDKQP